MKNDSLRERARRKLRAYLDTHGAHELARLCHVTDNAVYRWASGLRVPSADGGAREMLGHWCDIPATWWRASK
jgi:hypothetical protein